MVIEVREDRGRLVKPLFLALRPIAKLLLASGINYRAFSEAAKRAFVDIAVSDYGIRGRPASSSRVSIITGLTRKEIKKLREQANESGAQATQLANIPADVLHYWHTDSSYVGRDGSPRELTYAGPRVSFSALVRRTGIDVSPAAVLAELRRMGAVVELPGGLLRAQQRFYVPTELEDLVIEGLRFGVMTIAGTIASNAVAKRDGDLERKFQRVVETTLFPDAVSPAIKALLEGRLLELSEQLDDLLSTYGGRKSKSDTEGQGRRIGVGLYYFEEE